MKRVFAFVLFLGLLGGAFAQTLQASAELRDADGNVVGNVALSEDGAVLLEAEIVGFTAAADGLHGFHIHETGACEPTFEAAGAHFSPDGDEHGFLNPQGLHAGDLPNLVLEGGNAVYIVETLLVSLAEGRANSLFDADGSAIILHAEPDDYLTDPGGGSGDRIACGVITPVSADQTGGDAEGAGGDVNVTIPAVGDSVVGTSFKPAQREATAERVAGLELPEGFEIAVFAEGLERPRMMAQAPDGTIYVTLQSAGEVAALRDADGDGLAEAETVASDLPGVHGVALRDGQIYLATVKEVLRGDLTEGGITNLTTIMELPDGGQHANRTLAFGPDGMLYVNLGSVCNACPETNEENSTIVRARADGEGREIYARGLRNTLGFDWQPDTGDMWGGDMGTDWRGDNDPPEEINRLLEGGNYGWPYCYGRSQPDVYIPYPVPGGFETMEAYCEAETVPAALVYQAHSAPINLEFYDGDAFPEAYQGDAFVTMRGSWNRYPATGYKVVRVDFEGGEPVGVEDFVSSWLTEDGMAHFGRVAGLLELDDGSLLISEDTNGVIYRVTYNGP